MIAVPTMADCSRCGGQVELEKETLWCTNCDWKANLTDAGDECPDCGRVGKKLRQCGVCRDAWYCTWCHAERRNRSFDVIFSKTINGESDDSLEDMDEHFAWRAYYSTLGDAMMGGGSKLDAQRKAYGALRRNKEAKAWHNSLRRLEKERRKSAEKTYKMSLDRHEPCLSCAILKFGEHPELYGYNKELMLSSISPNKLSKISSFFEDHAGVEVKITYTNAKSDQSQRVIEPIEVYKRGQHEFLIAFCQTREEERTFRIDRILEYGIME